MLAFADVALSLTVLFPDPVSDACAQMCVCVCVCARAGASDERACVCRRRSLRSHAARRIAHLSQGGRGKGRSHQGLHPCASCSCWVVGSAKRCRRCRCAAAGPRHRPVTSRALAMGGRTGSTGGGTGKRRTHNTAAAGRTCVLGPVLPVLWRREARRGERMKRGTWAPGRNPPAPPPAP